MRVEVFKDKYICNWGPIKNSVREWDRSNVEKENEW